MCARYDAAAMVIINILKKLKKGKESPKGETSARQTTQHRETVTMRGNLLLRIAANDSSGLGIARCASRNGDTESRWESRKKCVGDRLCKI